MLAKTLRTLRKKQGITQQHLAQRLCITQQAVCRWEKGITTPDPTTLKNIADCLSVSVDVLLGISQPLGREPLYKLPIIGTVKAGYGADAFSEHLGEEPACVTNPDDYFYLLVKGDSMEPRIHDGDLALVHRQSSLESGDIGVVIFGDGEGTLKKVIFENHSMILHPLNPDYPKQVFNGELADEVFIVGRVVETKTKW